jgi:hypothetical protein
LQEQQLPDGEQASLAATSTTTSAPPFGSSASVAVAQADAQLRLRQSMRTGGVSVHSKIDNPMNLRDDDGDDL